MKNISFTINGTTIIVEHRLFHRQIYSVNQITFCFCIAEYDGSQKIWNYAYPIDFIESGVIDDANFRSKDYLDYFEKELPT